MKIKNLCYAFGLILFIMLTAAGNEGIAHGTKYSIIRGATGIRALYGDNSPMADADVKVIAPESPNDAHYVTGITDRNGCFLFIPDRKGEWTIIVDDCMGHKLSAKIETDKDMKLAEIETGSFSNIQMIIMALCVIWGAAGTALYFKKKRGE